MLKSILFKLSAILISTQRNYIYNRLQKAGRLFVGKGTYGIPMIYEYKGSEAAIHIGNYTSIAPEVKMITGGIHPTNTVSQYPFRSMLNIEGAYQDGNPYTKGDIHIGSDVWIGTGVTIISGVTIGHGAVLSANAVITRDVPPYSIVAGIPAKIINYRFPETIISELLKISWWEWDEQKIRNEVNSLTDKDINAFIAKHRIE